MEKAPRTGPMAPDDTPPDKGDNSRPVVKGAPRPALKAAVKGSLNIMHKKSGAASDGRPHEDVADTSFVGDGYSLRRLSDDEARRVLEGREGVVARQDTTDEFLAFLMSRPAPDDADPR